jgi:hypothetical protein
MNSQIMQQLRDLPSFCAALYELTKSTSMGADDGHLDKLLWTSILSFKNGDNFQIVNFWTLPQAIPPRRRVSTVNKTE